MTDLIVHPATEPLAGSVPVPSDAAIGQRALLLAALGQGRSRLTAVSHGEDSRATARCLRALGVTIEEPDPRIWIVHGVGLRGLRPPGGALECGASDATLELLCGVLAPQRFRAVLTASAAGPGRSLANVVKPLRIRGAVIEGLTAPLVVGPLGEGRALGALEHRSPVPDTLVKGAILLSGLDAEGVTRFREPTVSADHTERILGALGVPLRTAGPVIELDPTRWDQRIGPFDAAIPGDLSAAAFLLAASFIVSGSRVTVRAVGVNPTRTGFLEIARDMSAGLAIDPLGERHGEPFADVRGWSAPLRAIVIGGEAVPRAGGDIPIACALAARAIGTTRLRDVEPLRGQAPGELTAIARALRAFGVATQETADGLDVSGRQEPLDPADVDSAGDPRIAMTAAVLALVSRGPCRVRDAGCIGARYPKFVATLRALGARIDVE